MRARSFALLNLQLRDGSDHWRCAGKDKVFGSPFPPQLFDLKADPHELDDIARKHPDVVADLSALMAHEVDVEAADKDCKAYNLEQFKKFYYDPYGGAKNCAPTCSNFWFALRPTERCCLALTRLDLVLPCVCHESVIGPNFL